MVYEFFENPYIVAKLPKKLNSYTFFKELVHPKNDQFLKERIGFRLLLRNLELPWAFKRIDREQILELPKGTLYLNESLGVVLYGKITARAF